MIVNPDVPVDSASTNNFIMQNFLFQLNLRYSSLEMFLVKNQMKDFCCWYTNVKISFLDKTGIRTQLNVGFV